MDASQEKSYHKLVNNLEELTKLYRSLLEVIRKEKEILLAADIEKLNESNQTKDAILHRIRTQDSARERYAKEFAHILGLSGEMLTQPRLLELARIIQGEEANRLRSIHSMLEMLVSRCSSLNKENEDYAKSALSLLNGAMNNIKDTLGGKKTYSKQGQAGVKLQTGPDKAGNFVSKEV